MYKYYFNIIIVCDGEKPKGLEEAYRDCGKSKNVCEFSKTVFVNTFLSMF